MKSSSYVWTTSIALNGVQLSSRPGKNFLATSRASLPLQVTFTSLEDHKVIFSRFRGFTLSINLSLQFREELPRLGLQHAYRTFIALYLLPGQQNLPHRWLQQSRWRCLQGLRSIRPADHELLQNCSSQHSFCQLCSCCLRTPLHPQNGRHFQPKRRQLAHINVLACQSRYSTRNNRWIVVGIESPKGVPPL